MLTATVLLLPEMSHNPLTLSQHWCLEQMPQPMEELATPLQALILITNPGDAIGFGFFGAPTLAGTGIQAVTFDDGTIQQGNPTGQSVVIGDNLAFIVGQIDFNPLGTDDVITLFNVAATDTALGTSFATLSADLDNASFDTISISDGQASAFDEIRFGTSLASVTPGLFAVPEPSSMMILIGLGGLGMIRRRK